MRAKPIVYLASPYTKGDPAINVHFQCDVFDELLRDGKVVPYVPLWCHFQHLLFPRPYTDWINYDNAIIDSRIFAACLRLNAVGPGGYIMRESSGADAEVERFQAMGVPTFYSKLDLYDGLGL